MSYSKIYPFPLIALGITAISGIIASASTTLAEDITPIDDEITITVDSACTMGQTTTYTNPSLNPGETSTIGTSRISAYCNDASGYDIYAIGYTNGEYSNTSMQSTEINHTIPTGLSGEGSYWNMYLTPGTNTTTPSYIPTITNNFTSPSTIPNDYTKVATYPSTTIPQSEDPLLSGSYFTTTYTSHISTTQPAGVYTGQVQYVMVHPEGAPAPTFMQDTTAIKSRLTNIGDTMQAIDKRDGKKYWVTRLADGNIWMTQNLDHDIVARKTYTSADTDLPEGTKWVPSVSTYQTGDTTWDYWSFTAPESYNPGTLYWNGAMYYNKTSCEDHGGTWQPNSGKCDNANVTSSTGDSHYHLGNYYNWTAAIAMNDSSSYVDEIYVNQSICPAGWTLPLGGPNTGDKPFQNLVNAQNLIAGVNGNIQNDPTYFTYGGAWLGDFGYIGHSGLYWSSTAQNTISAYRLNFDTGGNLASRGIDGRRTGLSLRCIMR